MATHPCRCGYLGDPSLACSRAPKCAADYQARISGPLLDRIDLHVEVAAVRPADLSSAAPSEPSSAVAPRVAQAWERQEARYRDMTANMPARLNAVAEGEVLDRVATPTDDGAALLTRAADQLRLTARGYHRVLRVARTIADLAGADTVGRPHIAEALSFRRPIFAAR